jgi:hypothetical protein
MYVIRTQQLAIKHCHFTWRTEKKTLKHSAFDQNCNVLALLCQITYSNSKVTFKALPSQVLATTAALDQCQEQHFKLPFQLCLQSQLQSLSHLNKHLWDHLYTHLFHLSYLTFTICLLFYEFSIYAAIPRNATPAYNESRLYSAQKNRNRHPLLSN